MFVYNIEWELVEVVWGMGHFVSCVDEMIKTKKSENKKIYTCDI